MENKLDINFVTNEGYNIKIIEYQTEFGLAIVAEQKILATT